MYPSPEGMIPQYPQYRGWDPLAVLIEEAHKEDIQVHAWCHVFFVGFDSPLITEHEDWLARDRNGNAISQLEKDYYFFCPANPDARRFLRNNFTWLVSHYNLDGFQFDYIRYPQARHETQEYCFCATCRSHFNDLYGRELRELTAESNPGIWQEWCVRRRQDISGFLFSTIDDIRNIKPNLFISADVFPDPREALNRVYQPWPQWAKQDVVDFFCPMAYTDNMEDLKNRLDIVKNAVPETAHLAVGLGQFLYQDADTLSDQIEAVRECGLLGSVVFALNHFTDCDYNLVGSGVYRVPARLYIR